MAKDADEKLRLWTSHLRGRLSAIRGENRANPVTDVAFDVGWLRGFHEKWVFSARLGGGLQRQALREELEAELKKLNRVMPGYAREGAR